MLCNEALKYYENPQDIYRIPKKLKFKNSRIQVTLTRREADALETNIFSLFECPSDLVSSHSIFFVGKNHLKDTATIYKRIQIEWKNHYCPHAFIFDINRYMLADLVHN